MDKPIEEEVIRSKRNKSLLLMVIIIVVMITAVAVVRSALRSSIDRANITTSRVERGDVENTLSASGIVQPEFEEIITSPINASLREILIDAGAPVKAGQSVLTLDKAATQTELEKLKYQLESKKNGISKLKLELGKSFYDLKSNNDIKQLQINSLGAAVENAKKLYKAGGGTKEDIEQAQLKLEVALLEKKQLENEITSKQKTMQVDIRESEIAASIQQSELHELERKLKLADVVANREGVVTWINKNIGAVVSEGEAIARVADLASFKVTGSISDSYIGQLHNGQPGVVRIQDTLLRGTIVNIYPAVQNGIVSFDLQMAERNHPLFRPNMKVEVFLVTERRSNVLRVTNGAAFRGGQTQDVFVVNGKKANRKTVNVGLSSFDWVEIKDNLEEGDVVITSDMSEYKNSKEVSIED